MTGISGMLQKAGLPAQVIGVPPLFDIVYAAGDVAIIAARCAAMWRCSSGSIAGCAQAAS